MARRGSLGASALAIAGAAALAMGGPIPDAPLSVGHLVPPVQGKTLSGQERTLPEPGRAAVFVFGFSKDAATSMAPWLSACRSQALSSEPAWGCYDVRMVEGIPGLFRGFIERAMRKEYPAEWRDHALLMYRDNEAWQRRLGVRDPKVAQVLMTDAQGRVTAVAAGAWSEEPFESLRATRRD